MCAPYYFHPRIASECSDLPTSRVSRRALCQPTRKKRTHTHTQLVHTHPTSGQHTRKTHTPEATSLLRTGTGAGCVGARRMNKALCKPFSARSHSLCRLPPFISQPLTLCKIKLEFGPGLSACLKRTVGYYGCVSLGQIAPKVCVRDSRW